MIYLYSVSSRDPGWKNRLAFEILLLRVLVSPSLFMQDKVTAGGAENAECRREKSLRPLRLLRLPCRCVKQVS